jgi:hypothetical protein
MVTLHGRVGFGWGCLFVLSFFIPGIKIIFSMSQISSTCKLQGNKEQSSLKKTTVDSSGAPV